MLIRYYLLLYLFQIKECEYVIFSGYKKNILYIKFGKDFEMNKII